jgi:hypothetical protein
MARIGGVFYVDIDGRTYSTTVDDCEVVIQNEQYETVMSATGGNNYTSKAVTSKISFTMLLTPDLKPSTITAITNNTVKVRLAKEGPESTALLKEARFVGDASVDPTKGTIKCTFEGRGIWYS